ncbi:MAG: hypothetical protein RR835_08635 [Peptostreptococcaceae bacterium]
MDRFEVDMPDDVEIKNQINSIIDIGLKPKVKLIKYIENMLKEVGINNILFNSIEVGTSLVISVICIILIGISIGNQSLNNKDILYTIIFTFSPLFYILLNLLSFVKIKENNMYEIEMVCKYDIYQLISIKMLMFSFIGILFNSIVILSLYNYISLIKGVMISLTSLLLFSLISLYLYLNVKSIILRYLSGISWIVLNLLLFRLSQIKYLHILDIIPNIAYILVIIVAGYMYIQNIKRLIQYRNLIENI